MSAPRQRPPKPPPVRADDLTSLDMRVLEVLTESIRTTGVVRLAADMWRGDDTLGADPTGLVQNVVEHLGEYGLVGYRLHPEREGPHPTPYRGMAHDIRLTKAGWDLMGYPHIFPTIGSGLAVHMQLDKHGDRTNYRKHGTEAEGVGPIEVDDFPTHRANYPHHIHMYDDESEDFMSADKRQYIKVTPEIEARVLAARSVLGDTASYAEIGESVGLPERTARYVIIDLPRLRSLNGEGNVGSLKQRLVWLLAELPQAQDVRELRRVLGRADTEHDIVHVLHSLRKDGKVEFSEGSHGEPLNIKLTKRGRGEGLDPRVRERVHESQQEALPEAEPVPETPEPEVQTLTIAWPHLEELRQHEVNRQTVDEKATAYLTAAEAIEKVDPEAAAMLVEKANTLNVTFPSPVEQEYLRYAEAHP
jgi:hypothetical protein